MIKIYIDKIVFIVKKSNKLNVKIEGYDVALVDNTTAWILKKLLDAKLKFTGKIYLPTKRERVTVLKSPHKHKSSQEHLGSIVYRRLIQVTDASFAELNSAGLANAYPQLSRGVRVTIKV